MREESRTPTDCQNSPGGEVRVWEESRTVRNELHPRHLLQRIQPDGVKQPNPETETGHVAASVPARPGLAWSAGCFVDRDTLLGSGRGRFVGMTVQLHLSRTELLRCGSYCY